MNQHTFVAGCLAYYAENYYEPGNPEDGIWDDCHYPVPECLGGTATVKLLRQHHAIQGMLQSEEYQYPCIFGWEKKYLPDEYLERFQYWKDQTSLMGGNVSRMRFGKRVRVIFPDNTSTIAYSIAQAASIANVCEDTVKRQLRNVSKPHTAIRRYKPKHNVAFEYAPECTNKHERNTSKPKPILIHYPDGTIVRASSIKHASRLTNINQSTIQHRLKRSVVEQLSIKKVEVTRTQSSRTQYRFEYVE